MPYAQLGIQLESLNLRMGDGRKYSSSRMVWIDIVAFDHAKP